MTTEIHRYKDWKVPCSVDLFLTSRYTCVLEELVRSGKEIADILVIHGALWEMRGSEMTEEERKAELVALIQERLDSEEPGIEVTPEFWKVFKRRCRERTSPRQNFRSIFGYLSRPCSEARLPDGACDIMLPDRE